MENKLTVLEHAPAEVTADGLAALRQLRDLVQRRPESEKLVINGKQYLYFADWQMLGAFFGITARVIRTENLFDKEPLGESERFFKEIFTGYKAYAEAVKDGVVISSAEAICLKEEPNWHNKPRFQILSMAETRASAKSLRNCLQWVVRIPDNQAKINFGEEIAEELS